MMNSNDIPAALMKSETLDPLLPTYFTECCPVENLEDLYTVISSPPKWTGKILSRSARSDTAVQNVLSDCHSKADHYAQRPRIDTRFMPKTLVCHDYKGGYLEDRYLSGVNKGNLYSFYNWAHIDIFVYFSHHFVTIPPLCWINAAHENGVKVLGTFITEFEKGEKICNDIFRDVPSMQSFARHLAKIVEVFKLDGWLLNVENIVGNVPILKKFVGYLTACVHQTNPETLVIWYDSVIEDGKLSWQNELNEKNICFFDQCDGIYLNYVWTEKSLLSSISKASHRLSDVYVGIDVFGRNTFGGGQFNSYKAAEVIRRHNLSMAIFAPGWTHESIVENEKDEISWMEHFLNKDSAFWNSLWPYLYTFPINRFFDTSFFKGADNNRFNLFEQEQQLSRILHPKYSFLIPNYAEIPTLERKCHCLMLHYENHQTYCLINKHNLGGNVAVHSLFVCDIKTEGQLLVYLLKKRNPAAVLNLRMITCLENGARHVVWLNGKPQRTPTMNSSLNHVNPMLEDTDIFLSLRQTHGAQLEHLEIIAYSFYVNPCRILEIGGVIDEGESIYLKSFGIRKI